MSGREKVRHRLEVKSAFPLSTLKKKMNVLKFVPRCSGDNISNADSGQLTQKFETRQHINNKFTLLKKNKACILNSIF